MRRVNSETGHRSSILRRLTLGFVFLGVLLVALVVVAVWGAAGALREMGRAEQSFQQLETARGLEAAFNRYLLHEIGRRLDTTDELAESAEARLVRAALADYRPDTDLQQLSTYDNTTQTTFLRLRLMCK